MEEKFHCNYCKGIFNIKERGYFSYSQGNVCKNCWDKRNKEMQKEEQKLKRENEKRAEKYQEKEEKEFEEKVRKIVNKVLDEREHKK